MEFAEPLDLVALVPDKNTKSSLEALLSRPAALGTRELNSRVIPHPNRDAGVFKSCHEFLRPLLRLASRALVVFDREGCGGEQDSREALESRVEGNLARNGWADRSAAVVIDPELEAWVWADSPQVEAMLGWTRNRAELKEWLVEKGYWNLESFKPHRPKEAVEVLLHFAKKPRSSALYQQLATRIDFENCQDQAFGKLRTTLQAWFPAP
jgi:hypothetical protein